jgi:PEP-CTERM motif
MSSGKKMPKMPLVLAAMAGAAAIGLSSRVSSAAMEAFDNAANYTATAAQPNTWSISPANEGQNFGPWTSKTNVPSGGFAGTFYASDGAHADTAIANSGPGAPPGLSAGAYNGNAIGIYANGTSGTLINMYRAFSVNPLGYQDPSGLGTLINQSFSVDLQSNGVGGSGNAFGMSLDTGQGTGATAVLTVEYMSGVPNGTTIIDNDGSDFDADHPGTVETGLTGNTPGTVSGNATNTNWTAGIVVNVSVGGNPDGLNPYTLTISSVSAISTPLLTYSWNTLNTPIQQVDVFASDAGTGNQTDDEFFNSLIIAPEPGSLALFAVGGIGLLLRRRKTA